MNNKWKVTLEVTQDCPDYIDEKVIREWLDDILLGCDLGIVQVIQIERK
ncbi:hypothetical protein LCGC14_2741970 [marine sediment metagenome]|uniref:Uncharacterized protein n=1 Tax=marine sediment metagenome TaxID=412755 RepID=A0A0F8ZRD4_9ZZZZ